MKRGQGRLFQALKSVYRSLHIIDKLCLKSDLSLIRICFMKTKLKRVKLALGI